MEDVKWHQRAKINWFKAGDRNTQYFRVWANQRRRSNFIGSIKDMEGQTWTRPKEMGQAFHHYFQKLFEAKGVEGIDACISTMNARVSLDENSLLTTDFSSEEINAT
jgi:hypothetical protein